MMLHGEQYGYLPKILLAEVLRGSLVLLSREALVARCSFAVGQAFHLLLGTDILCDCHIVL